LLELLPACETLYIEPESYLFHVPFPALQLSDGSHLIEHIPLAVIPSASVLSAVRTRRPAIRRKTCMTYGIGESNDIYFANQAQDVARLSWESCRLFPERTRKADLLAAMREYSVIHFACHGSLAEGISDPLAASLIELFPPEQLTANDVLRNGSIPAELVFLNACQSGRFRMDARSEPDGFWRAFLHAGTSTLVGALTLVDPDAANLLALKFYEEFLGGASKAKAMQSAQCSLIRQSAPVEHWGAHVLVGDAA
jgi:CHAT domain-containing protein